MKYGKKLARAASSSTDLCAVACWMDYKALKKVLKSFPDLEGGAKEESTVDSLLKSEHEREFFFELRKELIKVSNVFEKLESRGIKMFVSFVAKLNEASKLKNIPEQKLNEMLDSFVQIHKQLVLTSHFGLMNTIGFTKILKKHDKVTGFTTKEKFMNKMVDDQPFSRQASVKKALELLSEEYQYLKRGEIRAIARPVQEEYWLQFSSLGGRVSTDEGEVEEAKHNGNVTKRKLTKKNDTTRPEHDEMKAKRFKAISENPLLQGNALNSLALESLVQAAEIHGSNLKKKM